MAIHTLFFTKIDFNKPNNLGIFKKVKGQVEALNTAGIATDLCYISGNSLIIESSEGQKKWAVTGRFKMLKRFWLLFFQLPYQISSARYSHIYIRHFLTTPAFLYFLYVIKKKRKTTKILLEIPTFPYRFSYKEAKLSTKIALYIDLISAQLYHYLVDMLVLFSDKEKALNIPVINIDNGIDLNEIKWLNYVTRPIKDKFNIVCLANIQSWHAFDRVINGLALYPVTTVTIHVHIIGDGPEKANLVELVKQKKLESRVHFYGFMRGEPLSNLMEQSHLAVGSLGMHRIKVADGETSPLKVREYTAMGIPFIYAYEDRILKNNFEFGLKLPADESYVDMKSLLDFYDNLINHNPNFSSCMRKFAESNFSWKKLMLPVFNYIKTSYEHSKTHD